MGGIWRLGPQDSFTSLKTDEMFTLNGHKGAVLDIDFTPDGKYLISGSTDNTAILWDVKIKLN